MPRCNIRRTIISIFVIGFSFLLLLSVRLSDQLLHTSSRLVEKEVKLVAPFKDSISIKQTFPQHPAQNLIPTLKLNYKKTLGDIHHVHFLNSTFKCGKDGILTVKSGGRLGNLMGEYATLWALAKRDNLFPILQHRTHVTLTKYFLETSVPTITNLNCSLKWNLMNLHVYNKLSKSERIKLAREGIFIDGYPTSVSLFHRHRNQIVQEFRFKSHYIARAEAELFRLRKNRDQVVFIGVHVRRTDYSNFLEGRFQAKLVGEVYFTRAMNYFREKFKNLSLFVVASDDMEWCRTHLKPINNDVVYAGNRNTENPAEDMALLAACNHTIISYGNFGFWSAYLGGGEVILAGNISQTPTELMHSIRTANISNWQFFPGF